MSLDLSFFSRIMRGSDITQVNQLYYRSVDKSAY